MTSTARRTTFNLQGFFAECEMRTVVGKSNRLRSIDIHLFSVILNYWIKMEKGLNNNESTKWREPFWNERRKIFFSFWRCYSNCEKYKVSASHDKATKVWGRKAFCRSLAGSLLLLFFYIHVKWPKRHSTRPLHTWNQFFMESAEHDRRCYEKVFGRSYERYIQINSYSTNMANFNMSW